MQHTTKTAAILLLADGTIFHGKSIGISGKTFGEVCFNTGMTGYQEIFTDPSYFGQIMVATNPHIGNYGVNVNEVESDKIMISGLVCKNFSFNHSRPDSESNLFDYFSTQNLICISDVDTRALVSYIRDNGAQNAVICTDGTSVEELKKQLSNVPDMKGLELASKVSTVAPYFFGNENATYKISALDLGIKRNILRNLAKRDCYVKVFPYNTSFDELKSFNPDGYFLSNGPGDPEPLEQVISTAQKMIASDKPVFGICLGHQAIAVAFGAKVNRAPELLHGKTSQLTHNGEGVLQGIKSPFTATRYHSLAIEDGTTPPELRVTSRTDSGVIMSVCHNSLPIEGVQFHPESVLTEGGHQLLANWLNVCGDPNATKRAVGLSPVIGR
jgi:carbamoyl-phosphate synthase small subunit